MVTGTGEEPRSGPGVAVNPARAVPDGVPPARRRIGADRVRRPADLLLAVFAFVVAAVVLGAIPTLPLGSTEVADVSAGVPCLVLVIAALAVLARRQWRDMRNAVAAGLAGAAAAVIATVI